jgi:hypothetical protein
MLHYKKTRDYSIAPMETILKTSSLQNYIPLYKRFFELNETNWNSIQLDNHLPLDPVSEDDILYYGDKPMFVKFSPILDPLRYLTGKYDGYKYDLPNLKTSPLPKMADVNNSSYVDGFFTFLTSLLKEKGFIHGTQFYGSYLGIKKDFVYTIEDDLEHLEDCSFFHANRDVLYTLNRNYTFSDSRTFKKKLCISDEIIELEFDSLDDPTDMPSTPSDDGFGLQAIIKQFPTHIILMENYEETLDSIIEDLTNEELEAAMMQVIMVLLTYQKVFQFTHNDLHTNNIMYSYTDEEFLYYKYNDILYKVPTFGKIYHVIDYGRSIYTFQKRFFMSDSYHADGDAATQYNIEPYLDPSEPIVEPNPSFDLCRLGCSMLDYISEENPFYEIVSDWCNDDNGESVVVSEDGSERYPDFELYRMIALSVHKHTPQAQLLRPQFSQFQTDKVEKVMDIDSYEVW